MKKRTLLACLPGILFPFGCGGAVTDEIVPEARRAPLGAAVFWQNIVEAEADGNLLRRPNGAGWNAGASSTQSIVAGDGFVELSTGETDRDKMAGLSHGDDHQSFGDIDDAFYLRGDGAFDIYEQGYSQGTFGTYQPGDALRVEVHDGVVRYRKNGLVLHTSTTPPTYPLVLDTSLANAGATITQAQIETCTPGDTSCIPDVWWRNVRYATADGNALTRDPHIGASWSSGASSVQSISDGDGFVEFSTDETHLDKMAGLSHGDDHQSFGDIDYAFYLRSDGALDIYEQGYSQGTFGTYQVGDAFRVEVQDGVVRYRKNGIVLHTSTTPPTHPLVLDTSLANGAGTITAAQIVSCASGDTNCIPDVWWKNVRYATADGNTLTRDPHIGVSWSTGASSVQSISDGNGFVEFSTAETHLDKMAGLSHGDDHQGFGDIDYAFHLRSDGYLDIYEQGWHQGTFGSYRAGDIFRVEVEDDVVRYRKNGLVLHTSTTPPAYPLVLDTSLANGAGTITDARVVSCAALDTTCIPAVWWKNVRYAATNGTTLTRNPHVGTSWSAGASSVKDIDEGDGYVQFSTKEANLDKMAGLGHGDAHQGFGDIEYALHLRSDGFLDIYEQGWHQGTFGAYKAGDVFRIEVHDEQVRYRKNGRVLHTSLTPPTYPLVLDTSLANGSGSVTRARVVRCAPGDTLCMPAVWWKNVRYATAGGRSLTRDPHVGTSWSAGASSVQEIGPEGGAVEFSTKETNLDKMAGLSEGDTDQGYVDIDYAFHLRSDGYLDIYERGWQQGTFGTYQAGDVFRVDVQNDEVRYLHNGALLRTSPTPPTYPLVLDTSLANGAGTITNARLGDGDEPTPESTCTALLDLPACNAAGCAWYSCDESCHSQDADPELVCPGGGACNDDGTGWTPPSGATTKPAGFVLVPPWADGGEHLVLNGYGRHCHKNKDHYSLDFDMDTGTAVFAAAPGTVMKAGYAGKLGCTFKSYGNYVLIDHHNGYQTLYAHLNTIAVEENDPVDVTTRIGTSGDSGGFDCTGTCASSCQETSTPTCECDPTPQDTPHLHFTLYQGATLPSTGNPVDPMPFLSCTKNGGQAPCSDIDPWDDKLQKDRAPVALVEDRAANTLHLFARGESSKMWHCELTRNGATLLCNGWTDIGGVLTTGPEAVWDSVAGGPRAFVRGIDGQICDASRPSPGSAFHWTCASNSDMRGRPKPFFNAAAQRTDVFFRASNDGLYTIARSAQGYGSITQLAGTLSSEPTVSGWGIPQVFFVDGSHRLNTLAPNATGAWPAAATYVGDSGVVVDSPAALVQVHAAPDSSQAHVFARDGDNDAMISAAYFFTTPPSQASWSNHARILTATPALGLNVDGRLSVLVRDTSNRIREHVEGQFGDPMGTTVATSTPVVSRVGDGRLVVFIWSGTELYYAVQTDAGSTVWSPWTKLALPAGF
ncbi:peptidoglycan DD-metalloendopeptidase family protein [Polyangium sp. 15x6]|uniref:peptidoglycan DD-metalloendopeptidase family protein n=1 Tax=Polyangium sp. 15x6 TaxID=3042687 RepID=UPI00249CD5E0|nr:peptidoglycan DD-metalloendopeptidase family protein [Polyangium sp. 15x6]MDI3286908.1 peptidoglycan DD-metalloendopeptidase family protein [Polyangium sp. 15x6]